MQSLTQRHLLGHLLGHLFNICLTFVVALQAFAIVNNLLNNKRCEASNVVKKHCIALAQSLCFSYFVLTSTRYVKAQSNAFAQQCAVCRLLRNKL